MLLRRLGSKPIIEWSVTRVLLTHSFLNAHGAVVDEGHVDTTELRGDSLVISIDYACLAK